MTGTHEPGRPDRPDGGGRPHGGGRTDRDPAFTPDTELEKPPRRSRQPVLTAAALLGIILLVLALVIFGGM